MLAVSVKPTKETMVAWARLEVQGRMLETAAVVVVRVPLVETQPGPLLVPVFQVMAVMEFSLIFQVCK
jgi:hypothetical protein